MVGNVASNDARDRAGNRGTTGVGAYLTDTPPLSPRLLDLDDSRPEMKFDEKLGMVSYDSLRTHFLSMDSSFPEAQLRAYFEALPLEPPAQANPITEPEHVAEP